MINDVVVITGIMVLLTYLILPWADNEVVWGGLASLKALWGISAAITVAAYIAIAEGADDNTIWALVAFNFTAMLWAPTVVWEVRPFKELASTWAVALTALASFAVAVAVILSERGAWTNVAAAWVVFHHFVIDLLLWTWPAAKCYA